MVLKRGRCRRTNPLFSTSGIVPPGRKTPRAPAYPDKRYPFARYMFRGKQGASRIPDRNSCGNTKRRARHFAVVDRRRADASQMQAPPVFTARFGEPGDLLFLAFDFVAGEVP